ncbi:hypothetical protein LTR70_002459 [Exophiala xenobiotica]|uniref:Inhibitor of growth protein N-terminal histone-binding domain-containing protein n=1 Tax=Lithohypha guttulata TaxID=1690604 RepID=A0ABR0KJQ6_9EURO|nr:hypothetical protein LTR24_001677 [Lithohypha guttulata]KAK5325294.1 hypothetical protein LTR70_002459 [Exophiala xenobiotica]
MAEIREEVSVNPDAQSAVTDFLDYTEYLPTDLIRSLSLIRQLDETYLNNADSVHGLTQTYGALPALPSNERPDALNLRTSISRHLDRAINARESAYAEAVRLFDLTDRHQDRLKSIIAKLNALPKPPSRDPTPQPQAPSSAKRSRTGRQINLTLKAPKGPIAAAILPRPRHRRVTVPGEVLPPYDPDEPIASTEVSDLDSEPPSPVKPELETVRLKLPKQRSTTDPDRKSREPRETSTYKKPTPPPENAAIGSKFRPWTHLSEWEMYKLRKKMKKNNTWEPSDIMIRRELAEKGRGWENYYKARAAAKANGTPFIDVDESDKLQPPSSNKAEVPKVTPKAEVPARPKTLKRTESKKEKKSETPKDAAAIAAQEAELAARRLGDIGSAFRNLFSPFSSALAAMKNNAPSTPTAATPSKAESKASKKRKLEAAPSASPSIEPEAPPKKKPRTLVPKPSPLANGDQPPQPPPTAPSAGTIKIPAKLLIQPKPPVSTISTPASVSRPVSAHRTTAAAVKPESSPPPSRPPSRRSAATSVEPSTIVSSRPSRRTSVTPAAPVRKTPAQEMTPKSAATAASRRPKREAPGTMKQSSQDGGAAVSVSKRKHKPNKSKPVQGPKVAVDAAKPEIRTDVDGNQELIDPDEETYCVCGDVSYGDMICCQLDENCEYGQWFHMECVELHEMPPRTVKWYCPGDRKKLHKGENSNGLVGRSIR